MKECRTCKETLENKCFNKSPNCVKCRFKLVETNKKKIKDIKSETPCKDCNKKFPYYVMQFDHLDTKNFTISASRSMSWDKLEKEMALCEIVCANCHAIRTHNRRSVT